MRPDDWHFLDDADAFLDRAGEFLRSRPGLHSVLLTVAEGLRAHGPHAYGGGTPWFGVLEYAGAVHAACLRTPPRQLNVTPLTAAQADALAVRLAGLGHRLPGVHAQEGTGAAFGAAWQRLTGAAPVLRERQRLYRLGTFTPPAPLPDGRARVVEGRDRELLARWYREFCAAMGEPAAREADSWVAARIGQRGITFWEAADGTPLAMAGATPVVAGQVRVGPVYTPAGLRGRGYAGAVTAEVSRAALAAGAAEVVLFADVDNPTSNGLYQRLGYLPVADFTVHDFTVHDVGVRGPGDAGAGVGGAAAEPG